MANTHSLVLDASSSQYASIADGDQTGLDITGDITIEAWIKLDALPTVSGSEMNIATKLDDNSSAVGQHSYKFYVNTADKVALTYYQDTANKPTTIFSTNAITTEVGVWFHVAIAVDVSAQTGAVYKNGSAVDESVSTFGGGSTSILDSTTEFAVGTVFRDSSATSFMDGKVDEVRVWDDIRSAAEIGNNYNSELVGNEANLQAYYQFNNDYTDETANGNDLTSSGSPTFSTDVPFILDNTTTSTTTTSSSTTTTSTTTTSSSTTTTSTSTTTTSTTTTSTTTTSSSTTTTSTSTTQSATTSTSTSSTSTSTSTTTTSTSTSSSTSTSTTTTSTSTSTSTTTTSTSTSTSSSTSTSTTQSVTTSTTTTSSSTTTTSTSTTTTSTSTSTTTTSTSTSTSTSSSTSSSTTTTSTSVSITTSTSTTTTSTSSTTSTSTSTTTTMPREFSVERLQPELIISIENPGT